MLPLAPGLVRYAVAVAATAIAVGLRAVMAPLWGQNLPLITFYPAIMVSAWFGGFWPGLLTTALSAAAAVYFWMPAMLGPHTGLLGEAAGLVVFIAVGLLISNLTGALHRTRAQLTDKMRELQEQAATRGQEDEAIARLAAIVQSSEDAIISKTLEGKITSWNLAATRMFGYSSEEVIGRSIAVIIPKERLREEDMVLAMVRRDEPIQHFQTIRRHKNGASIPVSLTVSPIRNAAGEIIGASTIARDVSARIRIEEERAILLAREQAARTEAEDANRAKDEFLAMLGHELRNPLGAISNAAHVLERLGKPDDATASARGVIVRQTANLARLMDDLLDVGRVMTGKIMLDRKPLDLREVAERAVGTLREAGKVGRHLVMLGGVPVSIEADATRIEQIVTNLVTNSLKYTPPGGSIRIRVAQEDRTAVLRVEDDGVGIDAALLPRIFDLFVQGPPPLDRAAGGLGIGLTVVKQLTELHGGSALASSAGPGQGTVVTVRFPAISAPPGEPGRSVALTSTPRRVLIVEDNDDAREMLRTMLELLHHTVRAASDGPTGIEAALEFQPDIALVDVGLPGLDGYEVARYLRASGGAKRPRLIALTGYGLPKDAIRAREAGFDAHLVKPIHPDRLAQILAMDQPGDGW
jgi:PAS domain S-box-containing protein